MKSVLKIIIITGTIISTYLGSPTATFCQPNPNNYHLIYGNRDGSIMNVKLGQVIDIPVWGATDPNEYVDSVIFMQQPLSTDNSIIVSRLGGFFPDTLVGRWDITAFLDPQPDSLHPGWTCQTMIGYAYATDPLDPENFFWTGGDTVQICTIRMTMATDTSLVGQTISPFQEGYEQGWGGLIWGMGNGNDWVAPVTTYPRLHFDPCCNYIPGDINGDGVANGMDVVYTVCYCKNICDHPPVDCSPFCPGTQHPYYAAADVNGSCAFNGIDITYFVNYLKGGIPRLSYCHDCPPCDTTNYHIDIRGDCLQRSVLQDSGYMVLEAIGDDLHIHHMDAVYQCCLVYFVDYQIAGSDITAYEHDFSPPCDCICDFDLESILYNLEPNLYTVRLVGIYGDTIGVDTVRVNGQ